MLAFRKNHIPDSNQGTPTIAPYIWATFVFLFLLFLTFKLYLATRLELFGDGAFYWLESRYPAISYSDVPLITPLLVKVGTAIFGDTLFGIRFPFIFLGSFLPLVVFITARPIVGTRDAQIAAACTLAMPFSALFGLLVVPDVPLLILQVSCLAAFERATRLGAMRFWVLTGVLAALAINAHYRFVFFVMAALLYLFLTRNGRFHLRQRGPWIAGAIAALGLIPILYFNYLNSFAAITFHFYTRHGWVFDPSGLLFLAEQALWVSPLIFLAFAVTLANCILKGLRGSDRHAMMAFFASAYILTFTVLRPWAVPGMITGHWALFGYMPLLVFLPQSLRAIGDHARQSSRAILGTSLAAGVFFVLLALGVITLAAHYHAAPKMFRPFSTNMMAGWGDIAAHSEQKLEIDALGENAVIVADNYYLASQLAFWSKRKGGIYNLDANAINLTGRTAQRAIWGLDEEGLRSSHAGENALVVVDTSTVRGHEPRRAFTSIERAALFARLCGIFERLHPLGSYEVFGNERTYEYYLGEKISYDVLPKRSCITSN